MKWIPIVILLTFVSSTAFADYYYEYINETIETRVVEKQKKNEIGVGADILLYETESADLVAEYKYDWQNGDHSAYTVVKTKKSLWSIVKGFFNRGE